MEKKIQILVEPMLYGDFRVAVWDENLCGLLDREYFCRGLDSAILTAGLVKRDLFQEAEIVLPN